MGANSVFFRFMVDPVLEEAWRAEKATVVSFVKNGKKNNNKQTKKTQKNNKLPGIDIHQAASVIWSETFKSFQFEKFIFCSKIFIIHSSRAKKMNQSLCLNPKNSFEHIQKEFSVTVTVLVLMENNHQTVNVTYSALVWFLVRICSKEFFELIIIFHPDESIQ